jgi:hypothetical protein
MTLGKVSFTECQTGDTQQIFFKNPKTDLCRVLVSWHSAKTSLSSARYRALGKEYFWIKKIFAECQIAGTRQRSEIYRPTDFSFSFSSHSLTHSRRSPAAAASSPSPTAAASLSLTRRRACLPGHLPAPLSLYLAHLTQPQPHLPAHTAAAAPGLPEPPPPRSTSPRPPPAPATNTTPAPGRYHRRPDQVKYLFYIKFGLEWL